MNLDEELEEEPEEIEEDLYTIMEKLKEGTDPEGFFSREEMEKEYDTTELDLDYDPLKLNEYEI